MISKRKSSSEHDGMVKSVADHLASTGHSNIKADIAGFIKPDLIRWKGQSTGHIPDVTSVNGVQHLFEVETGDSIGDSHTADQWRLFSASAQLNSMRFIVVVPKGFEQQARTRASQLGVQLYDIWKVA